MARHRPFLFFSLALTKALRAVLHPAVRLKIIDSFDARVARRRQRAASRERTAEEETKKIITMIVHRRSLLAHSIFLSIGNLVVPVRANML